MSTQTPSTTPVVDLVNLRKDFGSTKALKDVTARIHEREVVVLLGLSGSGKSTLLRHINGLEKPTSGLVEVLGASVPLLRGKELRALRRRIGFIFQRFELVGPLTALENVLTGSLGTSPVPRRGLFMYGREAKLNALMNLDRVGLLEQAYQRADTLSGGQQQRVAIARALMQKPEILLADEPVASLDPESADQVMDLIRELALEKGLTVIASLHQVDLALSWGDRILGLKQGRIELDLPARGLSKAEVMDIYKKVATSPEELAALANELGDAELAGTAAEVRLESVGEQNR